MVLITSLLFLLMLTTIAVTLANQGNRAPKMIANAELKSITFSRAQATLNEVAESGMDTFDRQCGLAASYDPFGAGNACVAEDYDVQPNPSIHYRATSNNVPRSESASGVGNYSVEYYRIDASSEQASIQTSLVLNTYKVLLADLNGGVGGDQSVVVNEL